MMPSQLNVTNPGYSMKNDRFVSQIMLSAIRFIIMSPPSVNDVARFVAPVPVLFVPTKAPVAMGPVGLAVVILFWVMLSGAPIAVALEQDEGVTIVPMPPMPVSVVRSRSSQSEMRF